MMCRARKYRQRAFSRTEVGRGQEEDSVVLGLGLLVLVSLRCEPRKPLSAALSLSSVGKLELSVSACSSLQL